MLLPSRSYYSLVAKYKRQTVARKLVSGLYVDKIKIFLTWQSKIILSICVGLLRNTCVILHIQYFILFIVADPDTFDAFPDCGAQIYNYVNLYSLPDPANVKYFLFMDEILSDVAYPLFHYFSFFFFNFFMTCVKYGFGSGFGEMRQIQIH